ncbi:MAG TPA: rRNA maturation RNase YbeY [Planctomycetes bacterium]|nr:rRNA maturation RNase YbeY [Planctomycetaceae bacterium]HIN95567.1 rRNA maturation RNase YbeY [Planctomycetota bacterium]
MVSAVRQVLQGEGVERAEISIAVVDDPTIHRLNVQYLDHDYPTDVLSFASPVQEGFVGGELVVSVDRAAAEAGQYGWAAKDELLLYVIHGALHLTGYQDETDDQQAVMRRREDHYLAQHGLEPHHFPRDSQQSAEQI